MRNRKLTKNCKIEIERMTKSTLRINLVILKYAKHLNN